MNYNIRKFAALFIAVALCFSSCKNEEEDPVKNHEEEKLLLKVNVSPTSIVNDEYNTNSIWIFLSDSKGKTVAVKKIENGTVLEFERPETFKEDKVFLNLVRVGRYVNGENKNSNYTIRTYLVDVATEMNLAPTYVSPQTLGNSKLVIRNVPEFTVDYQHPFLSFEGQNGSIYSYSDWDGALNMEFSLRKEPIRGLVSVKENADQPYKYKFFDKLETGAEYEVDFNELVPMENSVEFESPEAVYQYSSLGGLTVAGDLSTIFELGSNQNKMVKLYYPKDVFKEFVSVAFYSTGTSTHFYHKIGTPMTSFEALPVTMDLLTKSVDGYEFSTTGSYDIYSVSFHAYKEIDKENHNFNWSVTGVTSNSIKGMLPEIPLEIINEHPSMDRSSLSMSSISFEEYPEVDSKQYFDDFIKNTPREYKGYKSSSFSISSPSQRNIISKEMAKKQLEEHLKARTY